MNKEVADEESLIEEAMRPGGYPSRDAVVRAAFGSLHTHQKQMETISHFGTIDFDETYDDKAERLSKRLL
jgi:hypothetical protein